MGVLDDMGRLWDARSDTPRPGFAGSIKQAADAAEAARAMQAAGGVAAAGANGVSANPFENLAAMNSMMRGIGTVTKLADTGGKLDTASIYDVTFDVTSDTHAPFTVVHRQVVATAALNNWQVGKTLPLRFDPADLAQVIIG